MSVTRVRKHANMSALFPYSAVHCTYLWESGLVDLSCEAEGQVAMSATTQETNGSWAGYFIAPPQWPIHLPELHLPLKFVGTAGVLCQQLIHDIACMHVNRDESGQCPSRQVCQVSAHQASHFC